MRSTNDGKFAAIGKLIAEWQPAVCVVGLPSHPDGAEHEMTVRCRRFANQLHGRFSADTVLVDERYSSAVLQRGAAKASTTSPPPSSCNNTLKNMPHP